MLKRSIPMYQPLQNLRTAERYLLAPPLDATFEREAVEVCDISARGARLRVRKALEAGRKGVLHLPLDGQPRPVRLEAVVMWTQNDTAKTKAYVSGVRTYGPPDVISALLAQLHAAKRSNRIEELRSTERFYVSPAIDGTFGGRPVRIEDLSARGARIESAEELPRGERGPLACRVPDSDIEVEVAAAVVWTALRSLGAGGSRYHSGLNVSEKAELMRLAIGHLCEAGRANLDTHSLQLKLKILRARARQHAPLVRGIEASGIAAEQYLLIQGVRDELRLNPEEAIHWYRRARLTINDPEVRRIAPQIASHPDAIAVWEYLDRSVDPSIVGRAFALPA